MKKLLSILLVLALAAFASAQSGASSATSAICQVLANIQWMLFMIAAGVGVVVITLQGIKWVGSAEDPGARKQAKQGIIHAVVGLIIVLLAVWIVGLVFSSGQCKGWAT
jgi:hypothetical protein